MNPNDTVLAACLTPPAPGGIAVVQVTGCDSAVAVAPILRTQRPIDLDRMDAGTLRLARLVDGEQALDDVIVAVRRDAGDHLSIHLSTHGGPRIVQRLLLLLKRNGVRIVEPTDLLKAYPQTSNPLQEELVETLWKAKTRAVASWLTRSVDRLEADVATVLADLQADRIEAARAMLSRLCKQRVNMRYLLTGVRVTLIGEPNTGKSTLANQLAGRDAAIVSHVPGTTRDWTEHAGAIEGVPFTFVDTAGICETHDPIEQEAIRRTHQQIEPADLVLRVIDGSMPLGSADRQALEDVNCSPANARDLLVWNKSDLPLHTDHERIMKSMASSALRVSAQFGTDIDHLRRRLIERVGLTGWRDSVGQSFTERQLQALSQALSALTSEPSDSDKAKYWLQSVTWQVFI